MSHRDAELRNRGQRYWVVATSPEFCGLECKQRLGKTLVSTWQQALYQTPDWGAFAGEHAVHEAMESRACQKLIMDIFKHLQK